ncbi:hypothetical protein HMN09_00833800 [Mycena chlorophos]|uniref:DUF6534 domain-containing protein n=1 Tax=Mycena chlorophos TaxID=658473 RepID=A0A8H6SSL0_MYCCL|nr:hypothetical protein HMN09_00833800 [Mycena chlorophos]
MAVPGLSTTLGPIVLGAFVCSMLFGVITLQLAHYLKYYYRQDRVYVRAMVISLYLVHLCFTVSFCQGAYVMTVTDFGEPSELLYTPWGLNLAQLFGGITGPAVQAFLILQIYRATASRSLCIFLWTCAALIEGLTLFLCVDLFRTRSIAISINTSPYKQLLLLLFFGNALMDVVNASVLCFHLWRQRKRALSSSTMTLVDRLLVYTLRDVVAVATAIAVRSSTFSPHLYTDLSKYLIAPNIYIWVLLFSALPSSFMSAFLANVNNRGSLRLAQNSFTTGSRTLSASASASGGRTASASVSNGEMAMHGLGIQIQISRSVVVAVERPVSTRLRKQNRTLSKSKRSVLSSAMDSTLHEDLEAELEMELEPTPSQTRGIEFELGEMPPVRVSFEQRVGFGSGRNRQTA